MKRKLIVLFMLIMTMMVSGCVDVKSDITLKEDMTGTWKVKVYTDPSIKREDIEKSIKEKGLTDYKMTESMEKIEVLKDGKKIPVDAKVWEIIKDFKNNEDLNKISDAMQPIAGTGKKRTGNIITKNEDGKMVFNLSHLTMKETVFHVEGIIDQETTKGKVIDKSTIEFVEGQQIGFIFKPGLPAIAKVSTALNVPAIPGVSKAAIGTFIVVLLGSSIMYYRKRKAKSQK